MGYNIQKLIDILKNEDGYIEKRKGCPDKYLYEKAGPYTGSDNWTKYWKDLSLLISPSYQGGYYCIGTIFWGMVQAYGLEAAQKLCLQKIMINCQVTYNLFKASGQVYPSPKTGDIAVFWNGSRFHHAELVVSVKGDVVKTFGANTAAVTSVTVYNGGGCRYGKTYSLKAMQRNGHKFLRPAYGSQIKDGWIKDCNKWRYQLSDGTFAANTWKYIDKRYYAFDGAGNMITGWFLSKGQWYYLCGDGGMAEGWQKVDNKWYFLNSPSGEMHTGWLQDGDTWYYLDDNGAMAVGWKQIHHIWYVFNENGKMISNDWFEKEGEWYYLSSTGAMAASQWRQGEDGKWYYLQKNGKMARNSYVKDSLMNKYYFVDENGIWDGKSIDKLDESCPTVPIVI